VRQVIVKIENFVFSQSADIQQNPLTADANRYTERTINNAVAPVSYCCWRASGLTGKMASNST